MNRLSKKDGHILLTTLLVYAVNRFYLKSTIDVPFLSYFLHCHFNDLLGGICFLSYTNFILSHSIYNVRINSFIPATIIMLICGIAWEYVFPVLYPRGTADPLDIVAYVGGGILYIFIAKYMHLELMRD